MGSNELTGENEIVDRKGIRELNRNERNIHHLPVGCWWIDSIVHSFSFSFFRFISIEKFTSISFFKLSNIRMFFFATIVNLAKWRVTLRWSNHINRKKSRESLWKEQLFKHFSLSVWSYLFSIHLGGLCVCVHLVRTHRCLFNYHPRWKNATVSAISFLIFVHRLFFFLLSSLC